MVPGSNIEHPWRAPFVSQNLEGATTKILFGFSLRAGVPTRSSHHLQPMASGPKLIINGTRIDAPASKFAAARQAARG